MVGELIFSSIYLVCVLPTAAALPLVLPSLFSNTEQWTHSACSICFGVGFLILWILGLPRTASIHLAWYMMLYLPFSLLLHLTIKEQNDVNNPLFSVTSNYIYIYICCSWAMLNVITVSTVVDMYSSESIPVSIFLFPFRSTLTTPFLKD